MWSPWSGWQPLDYWADDKNDIAARLAAFHYHRNSNLPNSTSPLSTKALSAVRLHYCQQHCEGAIAVFFTITKRYIRLQ